MIVPSSILHGMYVRLNNCIKLAIMLYNIGVTRDSSSKITVDSWIQVIPFKLVFNLMYYQLKNISY